MTIETRRTTYGPRIGGEPVTTPSTYTVHDPWTEQVIADVGDADRSLADAAVAAAARARGLWAATPLAVRRQVIGRTGELLAERRDELVGLAMADAGARRAVAETTQVDAALARLRWWSQAPASLLEVPSEAVVDGLRGRITRTPVGVVACISPYNFPLLAMVGKVAPALFAGNTVVMKPAPQDPLMVVVLAEALDQALSEAGAPAGTANLVTGSGAASGAALVEHPDVGAVSFTGSTVVGIEIYRSAAPSMKRLLLELGGKGALVVRADADLDAAVESATKAWTVHCGQICITPARVIVHRDIHDELVERMRAVMDGLVYGDPRDPATTTGPLISPVQRDRVDDLVETARVAGARVEQGSGLPATGWFYPATMILDATPEMTAMQEEFFGPVVCVTAVDSDEEAVAVANDTRYGLNDAVFSRDVEAAESIAGRLGAGTVGINTTNRRTDLPFGGNKGSGLGRSGGSHALDVYTDLRSTTTAGQA